ncbi:hypothetical protein [Pseudomonas frederiksbergensis]|uniref:hypothetical protein n=1 Tax=Pseudomonas frederiksbergensis TaxID=104087 RepID=UPI0011CD5A4B|nr:hypothetical protein [Pseudomonas frederiksbergensis]
MIVTGGRFLRIFGYFTIEAEGRRSLSAQQVEGWKHQGGSKEDQIQRIGEDVSEKLDYTPGVFMRATFSVHGAASWCATTSLGTKPVSRKA